MDKKLIRAICIITVFSLIVAVAIGSIATAKSTAYLSAEIDEKIVTTAENFSNGLNAEFNHIEGLTDSLVSYATTTFDMDAYYADPEGYLVRYKEKLAEMIVSNLSTLSAHGLYVTFDPEFTSGNDEVWYAYVDGEIEEIFVDFQNNKRNFDKPYEQNMAYFFEPQGKDCGVWIGLYYDEDIEEDIFSYSRAIYVDGTFIGVAGADVNAEDNIRAVKEMNLYEGGYSALLDEDYEFIVYPNEESVDEEEQINAALKKEESLNGKQEAGKVTYKFEGSSKIMGYSRLQNGWIFVITQPEDAAYKPIDMQKKTMAWLGVLLAIVVMAFLVTFTSPLIKKNSTLEEENREKEIMLIYQSRQAKIGEMVGNITHQWKQPLNTINLILANLLDSYRYGDLDEKRLQKSVYKVDKIVDKMSETITDFSDFLKPNKKKEYFDVRDCIKSAILLMEESINLHRIKVEVRCETEDKAFGYQNDVTHVIFNLLNNARDAIVSSGPDERLITITISSDEEFLKVSVVNTGEPIPAELEAHIFEPYFTTKEKSGGTGLGLYISKQIVEDRLNGKIHVKNTSGGVRGDIFIPVRPGKEDSDEQ